VQWRLVAAVALGITHMAMTAKLAVLEVADITLLVKALRDMTVVVAFHIPKVVAAVAQDKLVLARLDQMLEKVVTELPTLLQELLLPTQGVVAAH
jgi:hypothetical protein